MFFEIPLQGCDHALFYFALVILELQGCLEGLGRLHESAHVVEFPVECRDFPRENLADLLGGLLPCDQAVQAEEFGEQVLDLPGRHVGDFLAPLGAENGIEEERGRAEQLLDVAVVFPDLAVDLWIAVLPDEAFLFFGVAVDLDQRAVAIPVEQKRQVPARIPEKDMVLQSTLPRGECAVNLEIFKNGALALTIRPCQRDKAAQG